jgi:hypothetical protein
MKVGRRGMRIEVAVDADVVVLSRAEVRCGGNPSLGTGIWGSDLQRDMHGLGHRIVCPCQVTVSMPF